MISYRDEKDLPYPLERVYGLISDVESYPSYLPWCKSVEIYAENPDGFQADMSVGFGLFFETFRSHVTLRPNEEIRIRAEKGLFSHLDACWRFDTLEEGASTRVSFEISFSFSSPLWQGMIGGLFTEAAQKLTASFEEQAAIRCQTQPS